MQSFFKKIYILVWKDFLIDIRRKDNILSMLLFLIVNFLIIKFSIGEDIKNFKHTLPGIIWVVFLFAGALGLEKSFLQERESGCIDGLLSAPVGRGVLFLGKMLGNTLFLMITQIIFVTSVIIVFSIELKNWFELFIVLLLGTIGFSSLGTLLTALTATVKGRGMLLPVLIFPLMLPGLLCVVKITDFLFFGTFPDEVWSWWKLLISFDLILLTISILGFEIVLEE